MPALCHTALAPWGCLEGTEPPLVLLVTYLLFQLWPVKTWPATVSVLDHLWRHYQPPYLLMCKPGADSGNTVLTALIICWYVNISQHNLASLSPALDPPLGQLAPLCVSWAVFTFQTLCWVWANPAHCCGLVVAGSSGLKHLFSNSVAACFLALTSGKHLFYDISFLAWSVCVSVTTVAHVFSPGSGWCDRGTTGPEGWWHTRDSYTETEVLWNPNGACVRVLQVRK